MIILVIIVVVGGYLTPRRYSTSGHRQRGVRFDDAVSLSVDGKEYSVVKNLLAAKGAHLVLLPHERSYEAAGAPIKGCPRDT